MTAENKSSNKTNNRYEPKITNIPNSMESLVPSHKSSEYISQNIGINRKNVGNSDYAKYKIQPWAIWLEYKLDPWDADIIKRVLRNKVGEEKTLDYEKIIHICEEKIRQLKENICYEC